MSGVLRHLRYVLLSGVACMLFVVIPFAITSALAACVTPSTQHDADHDAVSVSVQSAASTTGSLDGDSAGDYDDFEDILEQRLSITELRAFAAPASSGALRACSLRGRMEDGRREKPPRSVRT